MKIYYVKLGFLAFLFICVYTSLSVGHAEVVWSDDFDDGDYDGWEIQRGNWSAENGFLRVSKPGSIYHPSTTSVGTWSFDVYVTPVGDYHIFFLFMADSPVLYPPAGLMDFNGYTLLIYAFPDGRSSTLDLYSSSGSWIGTRELLEIYDVGWDLSHRWHHIDITRDNEGRICVYLNGELVIDLVDRSSNSSSYVQFLSESDPAFDNIVVKDYVDPPQIQEWSEDFDDGDLEGWIVEWGNWSADSKTLEAHYHPDTTYNGGLILYPSSIAYGTWSFDVYLERDKIIFFGLATTDVVWNEFSYSYYFEIKPYAKTEFVLIKCLGDITTNRGFGWYTADSDLSGWNHIDVTRDVGGRFCVFLNGELIMQKTDTSLSSSEHFFVCSYPDGPKADNITVRNIVDIVSPLPFDVSVDISEEEVIQGEDVLVSIQARDDYGVTIPRVSVNISLDGKMVDVSAVSRGVYEALLDTSEHTGMVEFIVTVEKVGFIPSESTHHIEVVAPASFVTGNLSIEPSIVEWGKQVAVTVEVTNVGGQEGSYQLLVDIEGVTREEITVTLDPGASETAFLEFLATESGTFTVDVGGFTETFTVVEPASFELDNLIIEPASVREGESISISVGCMNTGGLSGSYDVILEIGGEIEDTSTVTLDAGESTTVSFDVSSTQEGTYSVDVNGLTGSFDVNKAQTGIPGFPVESLIAGLAVVLLVLWFHQRTS